MSHNLISWQEVAKHNKADDCWIVLDNVVYDPKPYLNNHPGGPAVIQNRAGKDCTKDFKDIGHSQNAITECEKYIVGKIDPNTQPEQWQKGGSGPSVGFQQLFMLVASLFVVYIAWSLLKGNQNQQ